MRPPSWRRAKKAKNTLPVIDDTTGYEDNELCRKCGGTCCQVCAGMALPKDFGPTETLVEVLVEYLHTGFWAVDYWEGDPRREGTLGQVYYLRPAHTNKVGIMVDPAWSGVCRLWSQEYGCSLAFCNRPYQCRMMKPVLDGNCTCDPMAEKEAIVRKWIRHQEAVEEAMKLVEQCTGE